MEKGMKPSGTISSEASYCGSFSVKNPNYLFNDAENSYRALSNPHVSERLLINYFIIDKFLNTVVFSK